MLAEHAGHTATLLADGRVLIAGGTNVAGIATAESELYDSRTNRWTRAADMHVPRAAHAAAVLKDGTVLVTGGQTGLNTFPIEGLASVEIYHPATNTWTTARPMPTPRSRHQAMRLRDGRVLLVGGSVLPPPGAPMPPAESPRAVLYDPAKESEQPWSAADDGFPSVSEEAVTLMPDGMVLATGGFDATGFATAGAELFDPATDRWKATTWPMGRARYGHTATLLPDGRVFLVGGYTTDRQASGGPRYPNQEFTNWSGIFDRRGNNSDPTANTKVPRIEHTATLLRTSAVLVVGSAYVSNVDSELLDPLNSDTWISTGMRMDRYLHTATLLTDGRVLIAGGFGIGSQQTAWIYSPLASVASTPQPLAPLTMIGTLLLLFALMTLAVGLTSGWPERWGRRRRRHDTDWIDP
ncbi:MAG TPA: kelch repeat-containing protein [Candidatus Acidoferrum sp.]|nr:kelch repeat-containing protein [Candidatus Acidoferrum sp.]